MSYIIAEHQSTTQENGASHKKVIIFFAKIVLKLLVERELTKRLLMRILYVCLIHQYTSGCTRSHLQYIHITLPLFYSHCIKFKIVMSIYQVLCLRCRTSKCSRGDIK